MTRLTPAERDEIRQRIARATPGPWSVKRPHDPNNDTGFATGVIIAATSRGQYVYGDPPGGSYPANDQSFIARARIDLPRALDDIDALEAERAKLVEELSAAQRARPSPVPAFEPTHRHSKGALYQVIGRALNCTNILPAPAEIVVYRDEFGNLWARDATEFDDGRFAALASAGETP